MANTKVTTGVIKDDAVGADQLASNSVVTASIVDNAITTAKINNDAILTDKISNSAVTNAKLASNSVDSDQYVDASIDTAHIRDGQITSAKLDTNISVSGELTVGSHLNMGDGDILKMGASADLQIYHHSNGNSIISETGSGDLFIQATNVQIENASGDNMIVANSGGAVKLYYAAAEKLATTSSGVDVTGTVNNMTIAAGGLTGATSQNFALNTPNSLRINIDSNGDGTAENFIVGHNQTGVDASNNVLFMVAENGKAGFGTTSLNANVHIGSANATGDATNPALQIGGDTTYRLGLYTSAEGGVIENKNGDDGIQFRVKTVGEAMRIDGGTGNVGIGGSSSLDNKLELLGNLRIRNAPSNNPQIKFNNGDVEMIALELESGASGVLGLRGNALNINASGNVGIGTTSPSQILSLEASDTTVRFMEVKNSAGSMLVGVNGSGNAFVSGQTSGKPLILETNNTERMRIDSVGETTIKRAGSGGSGVLKALNLNHAGTSVNDGAKISFTAGASTEGAGIASTGQALNSADLRFYAGGNTERMRIDSSGRVLINRTSSASTNGRLDVFRSSGEHCINCEVAGTANSTLVGFFNANGFVGGINTSGSATSFNTSSDYRLKENLEPLLNGLDRLKQLNPVKFDWKTDGTSSEGFIAHEVQAIFADCVTGEKDGEKMQVLDYGRITPLLVKAIQEQQEQIETLKQEIQELKG